MKLLRSLSALVAVASIVGTSTVAYADTRPAVARIAASQSAAPASRASTSVGKSNGLLGFGLIPLIIAAVSVVAVVVVVADDDDNSPS